MRAPSQVFLAQVFLAALVLLLTHTTELMAVEQAGPTWTISLYSTAKSSPQASPADANPAPDSKVAASVWPKSFYTIGLFGQLVEVPSVKGMTWAEAQTVLSRSNLRAEKTSTVARNDDVVRNQNVAAGKQVYPGSEVKLFLVAEVPDVVGLTLAEAYEKLESQNGFPMKYNNEWPSDLRVTVQEPKAGAMHSRGRAVDVASMVKVPNLRGVSIEEAKELLTASYLYAEISAQEFLDEDRVLKQTPREGKTAPALSTVKLVPGAEVPDLIGLSPADADRALRAAGLNGKPAWKRVPTYDSFSHGRAQVTRQSIRPGQYVARGSSMRVDLVRYIYREQVYVVPVGPVRPGNQGSTGGLGNGNEGEGEPISGGGGG